MGEQASHSVKARNAGAKKHTADVKDTRIAQPNSTDYPATVECRQGSDRVIECGDWKSDALDALLQVVGGLQGLAARIEL